MNTHLTEANLNEFGRFDDLKATVDQQKAKTYFEGSEGQELPFFRSTSEPQSSSEFSSSTGESLSN